MRPLSSPLHQQYVCDEDGEPDVDGTDDLASVNCGVGWLRLALLPVNKRGSSTFTKKVSSLGLILLKYERSSVIRSMCMPTVVQQMKSQYSFSQTANCP